MKSRVTGRIMFYGANRGIFGKARILRNNMTLAERIIWDELRNKRLFKVKFRRQHPINNFIVDFYCHEIKLAIEIDGDIHSHNDAVEYDERRTHDIEKFGIKILRFTNNQVCNHRSKVIKKILETIMELKSDKQLQENI